MKKFTTALLAAAAITSAAVASTGTSATGFYLGANVGLANTNVKYDFKNSGGTVNASNKQDTKFDGGKMGYLFGAFAGYGMQMGSAYLGAEIYGGFDSTKVTPYDDSNSGSNSGLHKATVKRTGYYGLAPRVGFMVTPSTLAYVRLGIEAGKWKTQIVPNAGTVGNGFATVGTAGNPSAATTNASKNSISFAPGLGLEVFMSKNLFLRAEYSYLFGPKITSNQNVSGYSNLVQAGTNTAHTFRVTQHAFKVGVGFKF